MTTLYLLMIETNNGISLAKQQISGMPDKLVVAREENKYLLRTMGDRLMSEGYIIGYQLLMTAEPPVKSYEVTEVLLQ